MLHRKPRVVQLANLERRIVKRKLLPGTAAAARCYYRAAAEAIQGQLDDNAAPTGYGMKQGTQQHKLYMQAVTAFNRVLASWGHFEFTMK